MKKMGLPIITFIIVLLLDFLTKTGISRGILKEIHITLGTLLEVNIANKNRIVGDFELIKYIFPFSVILLAIIFTFKSKRTNILERICLFGIIGGLLGNFISKNQFMSIRFFVPLPFNNIADFAVVLFSITIMLSILITDRRIIK